MRRIRFLWTVVVTGVRWATDTLNNLLLVIALVGLTVGVAVGGVLLHRPAWFLGVFAGVLVLVVLGEGAYQTWHETELRAQTVPGATVGLSLLDQLRLDLKRGQGFKDQTSQTPIPDPALLVLARGWHDSIYKRLLTGGEPQAAALWLHETPAVPEVVNLTLSGFSLPSAIVKQQVKCLEQIIACLEGGT
jgi:hypothetical protein